MSRWGFALNGVVVATALMYCVTLAWGQPQCSAPGVACASATSPCSIDDAELPGQEGCSGRLTLSIEALPFPLLWSSGSTRSQSDGGFGVGFRAPWSIYVYETVVNSQVAHVTLVDQDGSQLRFNRVGGQYNSARNDGSVIRFAPNGGSYTLADAEGNQVIFGRARTVDQQARWYVQKFIDVHGLAVTLSFEGASTIPFQAADVFGNRLTISASNGKVTTVTDSRNRAYAFEYSGNRLSRVTYPGESGQQRTSSISWATTQLNFVVGISDPLGGPGVNATFYQSGQVQSVGTPTKSSVFNYLPTRIVQMILGGSTVERTVAIDYNSRGYAERIRAADDDWATNVTGMTTIGSATYDNGATIAGVRLTSATDALGRTSNFTYTGPSPYPSRITMPGGVQASASWNSAGAPTSINLQRQGGQSLSMLSLEYPIWNMLIPSKITHENSQNPSAKYEASITFDRVKYPTSISETGTTKYAFNTFGQPLAIDSPSGSSTFTYDTRGRVTSFTAAGIQNTVSRALNSSGEGSVTVAGAGASVVISNNFSSTAGSIVTTKQGAGSPTTFSDTLVRSFSSMTTEASVLSKVSSGASDYENLSSLGIPNLSTGASRTSTSSKINP